MATVRGLSVSSRTVSAAFPSRYRSRRAAAASSPSNKYIFTSLYSLMSQVRGAISTTGFARHMFSSFYQPDSRSFESGAGVDPCAYLIQGPVSREKRFHILSLCVVFVQKQQKLHPVPRSQVMAALPVVISDPLVMIGSPAKGAFRGSSGCPNNRHAALASLAPSHSASGSLHASCAPLAT